MITLRLPRARFSLRSMLVAALLWCMLVGLFFAALRDELRIEQETRLKVVALGGTTHAVNYKPVWLQKLLSDEDLASITVVHLDGATVNDDDLAALADLPALGGLHLRHATLSERAPIFIQRLSQLRQLDLSHSGLSHVRLGGLRLLQDLNLTGCKFERLELTDFPALESLNLGFSNADDELMRRLTSINSIKSLDLRSTKVTDRGIEYLCELPNLSTVYVYSTAVTSNGVARLHTGLPKCQVIGAR
jgi:hypothetical protein